MATQGIVTVIRNGKVAAKFIAGDEGMRAVELAQELRKMKRIPHSLRSMYNLALKLGFGCRECLVVMDAEGVEFRGDNDLSELYRQTFDQPRFNPRWKRGTADYVEIVEL